jgi:hypothetical protein
VLPDVIVKNPQFLFQNPENSGIFFVKSGKISKSLFLSAKIHFSKSCSQLHHLLFQNKICFNKTKGNQQLSRSIEQSNKPLSN